MELAVGDDGGRLASGDDGGRLASGDDGERLSSRIRDSRGAETTPLAAAELGLDADVSTWASPLASVSFGAASFFASVTLRMSRAFEFALERFSLDLNSAPRIGGIYR
jgi:hypothetical protein